MGGTPFAILASNGLQFLRQVSCPVSYRGQEVGDYRFDLMVENQVLVEVKSVERFEPVFIAQVLTYMKATKTRVGLIVNFNVPLLRNGIKRLAL